MFVEIVYLWSKTISVLTSIGGCLTGMGGCLIGMGDCLTGLGGCLTGIGGRLTGIATEKKIVKSMNNSTNNRRVNIFLGKMFGLKHAKLP